MKLNIVLSMILIFFYFEKSVFTLNEVQSGLFAFIAYICFHCKEILVEMCFIGHLQNWGGQAQWCGVGSWERKNNGELYFANILVDIHVFISISGSDMRKVTKTANNFSWKILKIAEILWLTSRSFLCGNVGNCGNWFYTFHGTVENVAQLSHQTNK